jgi:hypothetical protein
MVAACSQATIFHFAALMSAGQEVHNPPSFAHGSGAARIDTETNRLFGTITAINLVNGPDSVLNYHIHQAPFGVNGPVRVNLSHPDNVVWTAVVGPNSVWVVEFDLDLTDNSVMPDITVGALVDFLLAGDGYFNVHTTLSAAGEVRGQLVEAPVPEPATMAALAVGVVALARRRRRK